MAERKKTPAPRARPTSKRTRPAASSMAASAALPPAPPTPPSPPRTFKLVGAVSHASDGSTLRTDAVSVTVKASFRPASRAAGVTESVEVKADDILEIELTEGQRLWIRADEYLEHAQQTSARGLSPSGILEVPTDLQIAPEGTQARGVIAWTVKALSVLGIDLQGKAASQLAAMVDKKTTDKRPGIDKLFRCSSTPGSFSLNEIKGAIDAKQPILVFIHGTASSTWGSFGELWSQDRAQQLHELVDAYDGRLYAFDHQTLSLNPVENAVTLAKALPDGATVHLVSHSRGGLVGELLCRGNPSGTPAPGRPLFEAAEYELFSANPEYAKPSGSSGRSIIKALEELDAVLRKKRIVVERFARVACPALGTTLASGRLDRWLSVVGSIAGAALPSSPVAEAFGDIGDFFAAVIKERTDPKTLPGLEAMMPESALILLVNWPRARLASELVVIAGDIEPSKWWAKLLVWTTDRFYDGDHDLVVNTQSMYGGLPRDKMPLVAAFKGPEVNHFNYFRNADSAKQLLVALAGKASEANGFAPMSAPTSQIARATVFKPKPGPRPVVFLLPGIMGSELMIGNDRVWTDMVELMFGGLKRLAITASNVKPLQPNVRYYGELSLFLEQTHKVVDFPFDWRLAIETEADRLAERVRSECAAASRDNMPVRLIAHSMGGLVARTMIARHPDLWAEICKHPGGRLVMLGTPSGGSHAVTELIVGQSSTFRMLEKIDIRHDQVQLLSLVTRFPGLLSMLPKDPKVDYFSPKYWTDLNATANAGRAWVVPTEADLRRVREFRDAFDRAPIDTQRMLYVAGNADYTATAMRWDATKGRIVFDGTTRGDGRVTWDSGIPQGVQTWYMDVEHGDLSAHPPAFPALLDLLVQGKTEKLPQAPKISRGAEEIFPMPRAAEELYPNEEVLSAAMVGAGSRKHRKRTRTEPPIPVRVVHGNMKFARYPIMVGHYAGDTIVSAEAALDEMLDGQLTQRSRVGLYPAALQTSALFVNRDLRANPQAVPKGAVVVGLGQVGGITAATLSETVRRALLTYAIDGADHFSASSSEPREADDGPRRIGVSMLLIGTGAGGIGVEDSVYALLSAVDEANRALDTARHDVRIGTIEILELWEDRAIIAARALKNFRDPRMKVLFDTSSGLQSGTASRRRAFFTEPKGWWERIQIMGGREDGAPGDGALRFTATTRRARAEVRVQPTQRALVDQYIEQSIRSTSDVRSAARTLFDLLLPNELKTIAPMQDDIVLMVDEEAARYPWELLEDGLDRQDHPFATEHGMLRQLAQTQFREVVRGVTENNALVIGDPVSSFPELRGAQTEASEVWRTLQGEGRFNAEKHIRPGSAEVVTALYARPYRVLHLAGHGVYDYPVQHDDGCEACGQTLPDDAAQRHRNEGKRVTGMVLGDGVYLTPVEVMQMRAVPELVFINCCHLGRIEPGDERTSADRNERNDYNRIAANIATEFIRMGVQAVVAAGWMVDDAAASVFATTFYEAMLRGEGFGDAVKQARKETHERYPYSNTWGAYQCYGDPDYRLMQEADDASVTGPDYGWLVTVAEAIVEIENLTEPLGSASTGNLADALKRIDALRATIEAKGWLERPRVRVTLARAYGEAERFGPAIRLYEDALASDPTKLTLQDLERLANFYVRSAGDGSDGDAKKARPTIARGVSWIKWLIASPEAAPDDEALLVTFPNATPERLALMGSAYKRLARFDPKVDYLRRMAFFYREADLSARKRLAGGVDPYPLGNRLFAQLALSWHVAKTDDPLALKAGIVELRNALAAGDGSSNPWLWIMAADCELLEFLDNGSFDASRIESLEDKYRNAEFVSTPRQIASAMDQMDFLSAVASAGEKSEIADALVELRSRLSDPNRKEPAPDTAKPKRAAAAALRKAAARPKRR